MYKLLRILPAFLVCLFLVPVLSEGFLLMPHFEEWNDPPQPVLHYVKWWPAYIPVHYQICGLYDEPSLTDEDVAVQGAFQAWEDVVSATITFTDDGITMDPAECGYSNPRDDKNTATFGDPNDDLPSGVLGAAVTWMDYRCTNPIS